jgi:propionyl-CoA carboxylase beta chain
MIEGTRNSGLSIHNPHRNPRLYDLGQENPEARGVREKAREGAAGEDRAAALGRQASAHERIERAAGPRLFFELDPFVEHRSLDFGMEKTKIPGDGVARAAPARPRWTGGRSGCPAQDFTVFGGSLSETVGDKICKVMDLAVQNGARRSSG